MRVNLEKLRGIRLLIATHTTGTFVPAYVESLARLTGHLAVWGIPHAVAIVEDAFVQMGRDKAVEAMLAGDFTHLLFIDADIGFEPEDAAVLLAADKDVVAGAYQMKNANGPVQYAVRVREAGRAEWDNAAQAFLSEGAATGFMLIRRIVFERMRDELAIGYEDDTDGQRFAWFEMCVENGRRVSEDYRFCERWQSLGGEVWVCPGLRLRHWGRRVWTGAMADEIAGLCLSA